MNLRDLPVAVSGDRATLEALAMSLARLDHRLCELSAQINEQHAALGAARQELIKTLWPRAAKLTEECHG